MLVRYTRLGLRLAHRKHKRLLELWILSGRHRSVLDDQSECQLHFMIRSACGGSSYASMRKSIASLLSGDVSRGDEVK